MRLPSLLAFASFVSFVAVVACSSTHTTSACADASDTPGVPLPPGCTLIGAGCGPCCGPGCTGPSPTQADCEMFGTAAGCETSALVVGDASDCVNGCSFTSCSKTEPSCTLAASGDAGRD
jgi:hypothetical protein